MTTQPHVFDRQAEEKLKDEHAPDGPPMTAASGASDPGWIASVPQLAAGGCVSFVRKDGAAREVLAAFGADPSIELEAAPDWTDHIAVIEVAGHGLIAVEPDGGYQGTRPEVLGDVARLSDGGRSASVHWDVNDAVFLAYVEGRKFGLVELSGWDGNDLAQLPGSLRRWAKAHAEELTTDPVSAGITMASIFTGLAPLPMKPVAAPSFVAVATRPPTEVADTLMSTPLYRRDADTAIELDRLLPERQRQISAWVSRRLLEIAHLDEDPDLGEVVAQFGNTRRHPQLTPRARSRLGAIEARVNSEERRGAMSGRAGVSPLLRRLWIQHWAGYCLQYACHSDSGTAAWRAVYASIFALANAQVADPDNPLVAQFRTELRAQMNESD